MNIDRVLANNPGPYTGPGTNTWLLDDGAGSVVVIDPGPVDDKHLRAILELLGSRDLVAVLVTVRPCHSPGACAAEQWGRNVGKALFSIVSQELVSTGEVREIKVEITVAVVIRPGDVFALPGVIQRARGDFDKRSIPFIAKQPVGLAAISHVQVEIAIVVVIPPGRTLTVSRIAERGGRCVHERSIAIIPVELVRLGSCVGEVDVLIPIVVVISPRHPGSVSYASQRPCRDIGELGFLDRHSLVYGNAGKTLDLT